MEKAICSVGWSDHIPNGITWYVTWLPKGYAPTPEDTLICAFPDQGWAAKYSVRRGERPPVIEAVCKAVEEFMEQQSPNNTPHPTHSETAQERK